MKGGRIISNVFTVLLTFFPVPQNLPLRITISLFKFIYGIWLDLQNIYCTDSDQL